ncbi:MAG: SGNH/GDSL hydrolase family protein [Pseudodesulfovibrio sp.]|nr:SGNH/GDSL hydrolase family protein [Pseudodesulfovibrio sp.]
MKKILHALKSFFIFLFILAVCLEIGSCIYIRFFNTSIPLPTYSMVNAESSFWVDIDPYFGVWHDANSTYMHNKQCATVYYTANSHGMRAPERDFKSDKPRIAVLGDSFVEGYIIEDGHRLTDLMEKAYGMEFLNYGTSGGFGTLQEWLQYKHLVKKFDHDAIMIGILPSNDFGDNLNHPQNDRYRRPYLAGKYPDYQVLYNQNEMPIRNRTNLLTSFDHTLREWSYTYRIARYLDSFDIKNWDFRARWHSKSQRAENVISMYYDFTENHWNSMRYSLERIVDEADGKPIFLFVIPRYTDFLRYKGTPPPLSLKIEALAKQYGLGYLDLLPEMNKRTTTPEDYYLLCDPHWNNYGNEVAFEILNPHVEKMIETIKKNRTADKS